MHRVHRRLLAAPLAVLAASCADPHSPTAPPIVEAPSFSMTEDYGTGGLPGFAFRPPVADDEVTGEFDDGLLDLLAVEICEWSDGACASVVRTITQESPLPARLRTDGNRAYHANWQTKDDRLDPDADYRIRVLASGAVVGWADVDVLKKGGDKAGDGRVPVKNGSTLPIKFWIPVGLGERAGQAGGTVELADGLVTLDLPPGALPEDVLITATPTELPPDAPPFVGGTAWDFGPDGLVFDEPVTLTIRYDPADIPPGTDESELRIHKLVDGTFVQQDAGTIDLVNHTASATVNGFSVFVLLERLFPGSPEDLEGPEVVTLEVLDVGSGTYGGATTIDVSGGDQTVDVRLDLTDDISGVQNLQAQWTSPDGEVFFYSCYPLSTIVTVPPDAGSDTNGSWSCPTIWPRYSQAGVWRVNFVSLVDKVGNFRSYFDFGAGDLCDTANRSDCIGASPEVTVVSAPEDVTAPSALSLDVSLTAQPRAYGPSINVDASAGGVGVVFGLRATDDLSGLGSEPNLDLPTLFYGVTFLGPSNQGFGWYCQSTPASGTSLDGFFECFSSIPQSAEEGTWRVTYLNLSDRAGNTDFYNDNGAGELCNQDGDCIAQPTVEVGGMGDADPPTLEGYALSVTDNEVTITVDVTDPGSGVSVVQISYRSQVANQSEFCTASLTAGTRENGTWSCTITFSEFAARGEWRPTVFTRDGAFNTRNYQRGSADGLLCYFDAMGAEVCQDFGDTDIILE